VTEGALAGTVRHSTLVKILAVWYKCSW